MATATRQLGRRGQTNPSLVNTTNPTGTTTPTRDSRSTPPRRYVLDVPSGRTVRKSRTTSEEFDSTKTTNRSRISSGNDELVESISRSASRDYYYRDVPTEATTNATVTRYLDDASIKQLIETTTSSTNYTNTVAEDQEVQALTAQATPDVKNYPINVDSNPELIVRPNTQRLTYKQDIAVRYLKPETPPPPGPIIIREIRAPAPPPAPPIILRQRPPPPRTPSPVIIREKPPVRPKSVPTTIIKKVIPPPPPPPRKLIIERLPNLPPKPRPVIIERWLPYEKQRRQVVHEKAKPVEPQARIKNTIIEWRPPEVEVVKQVKKLGVQQADPQRYYSQHGDKLYTTEFVQRKLTELGLQEELALMQEQQDLATKQEIAFEQANDQNVRQILNGYGQSTTSRSTYTATTNNTNGTIVRLIRSSSQSGITDEYGEQILYDRSPNNSTSVVYERSTFVDENNFSGGGGGGGVGAVLTEEMLLRANATNGGKFPSHLLSKLGSQIYDIPADQVDLNANSRRVASTVTRYYNVNQGEMGYETVGADETGGITTTTTENYPEEKYVQIKASDLKDVLANYDLYSSTGEKLQGEQINF